MPFAPTSSVDPAQRLRELREVNCSRASQLTARSVRSFPGRRRLSSNDDEPIVNSELRGISRGDLYPLSNDGSVQYLPQQFVSRDENRLLSRRTRPKLRKVELFDNVGEVGGGIQPHFPRCVERD